MFEIIVEDQFKKDFKKISRRHKQIARELKAAVNQLMEFGKVPDEYKPHELTIAGENYTGHIDFHLSDGNFDVIVLYMPHKTNPSIRLVRIGSHKELFNNKLLWAPFWRVKIKGVITISCVKNSRKNKIQAWDELQSFISSNKKENVTWSENKSFKEVLNDARDDKFERIENIELQKAKEKLRVRLDLAAKETKEGLTIPYEKMRKLLWI